MKSIYVGFVDSRSGHLGSRLIAWFLDSEVNHVFGMIGDPDFQDINDFTVYETSPTHFLSRPYSQRKDTVVRVFRSRYGQPALAQAFWERHVKERTFYNYPALCGHAVIIAVNLLIKCVNKYIPGFFREWTPSNPLATKGLLQCSEATLLGLQAAFVPSVASYLAPDMDPTLLLKICENHPEAFEDVSKQFCTKGNLA